MMMRVNNVDEEDEDVVIQGSALHEHLSKLGYTDFESVPMPRRTYFGQGYLDINIRSTVKDIYAKLFSLYSKLIQEKSISKKQLSVILEAEVLLNDHSSMINSFLINCNNNSEKITPQELIASGVVLIPSKFISRFIRKHKILRTVFVSCAICCVGYLKYLRFCANRDLQNVISLQNELFALCKEGLKILRRDYRIQLGFEACQQFSHFLGKKLQYLQPLTDTLIKFMENISYVYYQCSLSIAKLLPPDALNEELFTKFESNSFEIDEVSYQTLKNLYHTYLLVQSEMLCLLAIAYDSNTWIHSCQKIPERKLAHMIHTLTKDLTVYKIKLSKLINAYRNCKAEPVRYKARDGAKWHDPNVQLDLASYKLQLAYNQVFSIFKDIDDYISQEIGIDSETADILMQKLDKVFKDIDTAKSLVEFVVLLMARSGFNNLRKNQPVTNNTTVDQNPDLPMIMDSDPEIVDEVFEEYINEEYLKSSHEETDEYSLEQQKLDKVLLKNFMSELKEALVDKHKSMSERESKALQRIYKNISMDPNPLNTEGNVNKDCQFVPAPPPMPSSYICSSSNNFNLSHKKITSSVCKIKNVDSREKFDESDEENYSVKVLKHKNIFDTSTCGDRDEESSASLPQILLETQATKFVTKLPPAFLQEEIFIGSGENSEDEVVDNACDSDEDNENSIIKR